MRLGHALLHLPAPVTHQRLAAALVRLLDFGRHVSEQHVGICKHDGRELGVAQWLDLQIGRQHRRQQHREQAHHRRSDCRADYGSSDSIEPSQPHHSNHACHDAAHDRQLAWLTPRVPVREHAHARGAREGRAIVVRGAIEKKPPHREGCGHVELFDRACETRVEREIGGRTLILETGKVARQAGAAVLATYGGSTVLATVVRDKPREGIDFFPLTVDYREKLSAAGKFPGGYFKREGRPTEKEILTSRLIDRPIRPLFAQL